MCENGKAYLILLVYLLIGFPISSKKIIPRKTERTTVPSEFGLFCKTKNFRNSVPSHSEEQKEAYILYIKSIFFR